MLRSIKLSVDQPYIDPGSTIAHVSTSYQVSKTPDFTNVANLVINIANDTINLLSYRFEYDIQPAQPLYVRTRYHLNNGNSSSWSSPIELGSNQLGFKSSGSILATPIITSTVDYTNSLQGELVVTLDNTIMYSGSGSIIAVSWTIETTNGEMVYELPNSSDMINELRLPISDLNNNDVVVINATTHSSTNGVSNKAQTMAVINGNNFNNYFLATIKGQLYADSNNYISVKEHAEQYTTVDVRVTDNANIIVSTSLGLDPYMPVFSGDGLNLTTIYIVEVRANRITGTPTPWVECYRGYAIPRPLRVFAPSTTYDLTKMNFTGYINFNGLSAQTIQCDEDDLFYMAVPETTTIASYRATAGRIYPTGNVFDLGVGNLFNIPNINYLRLPTGQMLIDHNLAINNGNTEVAAFTLFDYHHITKKLTKIRTNIRTDERHGSGRSGSAVVMRSNIVYYVPGEMVDPQGNILDLELRVYDVATDAIIDHIPLPVTGLKQNVSLTEDINGDIYMFGGSHIDTFNAVDGELFAPFLNANVYKLDKIAKTWTLVGSAFLDPTISYRYRMIPLKDGTILILNTTPTLLSAGANISHVFDPSTGLMVTTIINNPTNENLGISVELYNGDRYLMSSTVDLVESLSVIKTTTSNVVDSTTVIAASQRVLDLVVPVGDVVYMRDPLLYNTITIDGTSLGSTGKLVWIDRDVTKEYFYNDRIITRDTTMTIPAGQAGPAYNNLVILGNAKVNIIQL